MNDSKIRGELYSLIIYIMNIIVGVLIMVIVGWVTMTALIEKNITVNLTKIYVVLLMAAVSSALMLLITRGITGDCTEMIIIVAAALILFVALRKQFFVSDKQYLLGMIEHHEMAIVTSTRILEKSKDEHVRKLAQSIITTQKSEIEEMRAMLDST